MNNSSSNDITIAVTVYDRRQYIIQAIQSALDQTVPVKVIVVEDCGPDSGLQDFVLSQFGDRVEYFRNSHRRGLFDNWNACIELCTTPYLSILHDDDFLNPSFIATMKDLTNHLPNCGLYFGRTDAVDERGDKISTVHPELNEPWRKVSLLEFAAANVALFPGQLIRVESARALGGFRSQSFYCGDYEMWAKLTAHFGAAQTSAVVANVRMHRAVGRGTTRVERSGKIHAFTFVQQKRVAAMLRTQGINDLPSRYERLRQTQLSSMFLLWNAAFFSPRMLRYNYRLFLKSGAPNWRYWFLQQMARFLGPSSLKWASKVYRSLAARNSA
jgi:glycosyltransferase involved in cell wall biosynthesis